MYRGSRGSTESIWLELRQSFFVRRHSFYIDRTITLPPQVTKDHFSLTYAYDDGGNLILMPGFFASDLLAWDGVSDNTGHIIDFDIPSTQALGLHYKDA